MLLTWWIDFFRTSSFQTLLLYDYRVCFFRDGKVSLLKYLVSDQEPQCAISNLTEDTSSTDDEEKEIVKNICVLYSKKKLNSVNDGRFKFFVTSTRKEIISN